MDSIDPLLVQWQSQGQKLVKSVLIRSCQLELHQDFMSCFSSIRFVKLLVNDPMGVDDSSPTGSSIQVIIRRGFFRGPDGFFQLLTCLGRPSCQTPAVLLGFSIQPYSIETETVSWITGPTMPTLLRCCMTSYHGEISRQIKVGRTWIRATEKS